MRPSIVVPYRPSPERERTLKVTIPRLREWDPAAEVIFADDPASSFNRGRALNDGAARARGDLFVFADADLVVPHEALDAAVTAIENGAALVVPFSSLVGLSEAATERVIAGRSPFGPWGPDDIELDWPRLSTGGLNVISRDAFFTAGGFDPRFAGWGGEDGALDPAVATLVGPLEWVRGVAVHLWHPTDASRADLERQARMIVLCARYEAARGDADAMRALIRERGE